MLEGVREEVPVLEGVGVRDVVAVGVRDVVAVLLPLAKKERLLVGDELIVLVNDSVVVGERLSVAELVPDGD